MGGSQPWLTTYRRNLIILDVLTAVSAFLIADTNGWDPMPLFSLAIPAPVVALSVPVLWVLALEMSNAYERRFVGVSTEEYRAVGRAVVGMLALIAIIVFAANQDLSRLLVARLLPLLLVGGLLSRWVLRKWLFRGRLKGKYLQSSVVIGRVDAVRAIVRSLQTDPGQGLSPVAVCASTVDHGPHLETHVDGIPVVGGPTEAVATADRLGADVVVVASHPDLSGSALRRLAWDLEERGIELIVSPGLLDIAGPRMSIRPSRDLSLLHIERAASARRTVIFKRLMDAFLASALLVVLSPVLLFIAMLVKGTDAGPVLFRQGRVGIKGEGFRMLKFRTMVVDAEKHLSSLRDRNQGHGVLFKISADPRVTKVGRFLRRFSLDELPQLVNVLRGEMSLVGPRPPLPSEVEQYEPDAARRLHVRPGMTGLWQVSGRSDLTWAESLRLDLHYVDNWSPILDLLILVRTVRAVAQGRGAY